MDANGLTVTQWPAWWEFMMQWAGVFTQAAAAIGAILAVWVALHIAGEGRRRDESEREEIGVIVTGIVLPEVRAFMTNLLWVVQLLEAHKRQVQQGKVDESLLGLLGVAADGLQLNGSTRESSRLHYLDGGRGRAVGYMLGLIDHLRADMRNLRDVSPLSEQARDHFWRQAYQVAGRLAVLGCDVLNVPRHSHQVAALHNAMEAAKEIMEDTPSA